MKNQNIVLSNEEIKIQFDLHRSGIKKMDSLDPVLSSSFLKKDSTPSEDSFVIFVRDYLTLEDNLTFNKDPGIETKMKSFEDKYYENPNHNRYLIKLDSENIGIFGNHGD